MPSRRRSHIERLEPRWLLTSTAWALDSMNVQEVWDRGYTGQGIVVAVIDAGIAIHSDLWSNVWVNEKEVPGNRRDDDANGFVDDAIGWDFVDDDSRPIHENRHGTQVAGAIAAERNEFGVTGVAYDAEVMPIRVVSESGEASTADIADAIRYATDNGADVINLSFGGITTRRLELAIAYAASSEVLIVAASGNAGDAQPVFPAQYSATYANVISVGAHDESFKRSATSNRVGKSGAIQVDAPGVNVISTSTRNSYLATSGTSIAAAQVAGIAALTLSANPRLSAAELRTAIVDGAIRSVYDSDSQGAVDAQRTISQVTSSVPSNQLAADFDLDGNVGFRDFLILVNHFGIENAKHTSGDANGNGKTEFLDFLTLVNSFGQVNSQIASRRPRASAMATDAVFAQQSGWPFRF